MTKSWPYLAIGCFVLTTLMFASLAQQQFKKNFQFETCFKDARDNPESAIHSCKDNAQIVAELVIDRDKTEKCDAAISQGFSSADCTARVQALALENANQKAQILTLETDQKAAIKRAENRNQTLVKKKSNDVKALEKAKTTSNGDNIICDTECLRARFETD